MSTDFWLGVIAGTTFMVGIEIARDLVRYLRKRKEDGRSTYLRDK